MKTFKINILKAICFSILLCIFSVTANAALISNTTSINFNSLGGFNTGMVNYQELGGALLGTNIDIGTISGIGTAANAGNYTCQECKLNFATGNLIQADSSGSTYVFDAGGFFEITGTILTGIGADIVSGITPLLMGEWTAPITVNIFNGAITVSLGIGIDTKHPDLLDFFGETGNSFSFANTNISLADLLNPISAMATFETNVIDANVTNISNVPLPGALWLLASGLMGLVMRARCRNVS